MIPHRPSSDSTPSFGAEREERLPQLIGGKPGESAAMLLPQIPDGGEAVLSGQPRDLAGDRAGTPADSDAAGVASPGELS